MRVIKESAGDQPSRFLSNKAKAGLGFVTVVLGFWLVAWVIARCLIISVPLAHADAIAVMAGSAAYKERTQRAAELYTTGRARKIILTNDNQKSGWSTEEQRNIPYYELASRALRRQGVPESAIETLPDPVSGTYDESLLLREYAEAKGLSSLLVVTSAYHSRRAFWTMRQTFHDASITIGIEPVPPGQQTPSPVTWWLHLSGWEMVAGEHLKMFYYLLSFD
jgi:uncharacterized SAM-binding protein YcdF (DUF218 family)